MAEEQIQNNLPRGKRPRGNPAWRKGICGNPAGRPKSAAGLRQYLQKKYGQDAQKLVDKLDRLAKSKNDRVALSAVELLIAYHAGKPTTVIDVESKPMAMLLMPEECWPDVGGPTRQEEAPS
jgi:hypothetical protein